MKSINNKGFTLIELIGIIVVLVAIFLVSLPYLLGVLKSDEEKLYNTMVNDLCIAGKTYIYSNMDSFDITSSNTFYIEINILIENGFLKDRKNPNTNESIKDDKLEITVLEDNSLECEYIDN